MAPIIVPAPTPTLTVEWARRGDLMQAPSLVSPSGREPMMVLSRCDRPGPYFCEPCKVNLANVGQLEMHLEPGGTHRIAVWCQRHGVYEQANPPEWLALQ